MDLTLQSAFLAEMSTLLILLAGAVLLYSSFREKYLVPWIAGWSVFTLSKVFLALSSSRAPAPTWTALAYGSYVVAVGLFATAVFFYVSQRKLLWPAIAGLERGPAAGGGVLAVETVSGHALPWRLPFAGW